MEWGQNLCEGVLGGQEGMIVGCKVTLQSKNNDPVL